MKSDNKVLFITRTAVFLALLVAVQAMTAPLGNTIVTGSLVNMLLALCAVSLGIPSGLIVAVASPVLAKLIGIGSLWEIVIFIMAANAVFVILWNLLARLRLSPPVVPLIISAVSAAFAKFIFLYITVVQIAVPVLLQLEGNKAAVVSAMFSAPQLVSALIGGAIAIFLIPIIKKFLRRA